MRPVLVLVAGPDGAGKSTLAAALADQPWSEGVEFLRASAVGADRIGELLRDGRALALETVLAGAGVVRFLERAKASGCFVRVFFVGTSDPRINAARIAGRVLAGGAALPFERMLERYVASIANLTAAIRLADRVYVFDNSVDGAEARLAARIEDGRLCRLYGALPEWVAAATLDLDRRMSDGRGLSEASGPRRPRSRGERARPS